MRISIDEATQALALLLEGMSIRSTERVTGLHRDTLCDLVATVGINCTLWAVKTIVEVPVKDVHPSHKRPQQIVGTS